MATSIFSFATTATLIFIFNFALVRSSDEPCSTSDIHLTARMFAPGGATVNTSVDSGTSHLYIECLRENDFVGYNGEGVYFPYVDNISCKDGDFMINSKKKIKLKLVFCKEVTSGCSTLKLPVNVGVKNMSWLVKYEDKKKAGAWCLADPSQTLKVQCVASVWMNLKPGEPVVLDTSHCPEVYCNASSLPPGMTAVSEDGEPIGFAGKNVSTGTRLYTSCTGDRSMLNHTNAPSSGAIAYLYSACYQGSIVSQSDNTETLSQFECVEDAGACLVEDLPDHFLLPNMTFMAKYPDRWQATGRCEDNEKIAMATFCQNTVWAATPADGSRAQPRPMDEGFVERQCGEESGLEGWEIALIVIAAMLLVLGAVEGALFAFLYYFNKE